MDKKVILKNPPRGSLRFGHPWVYRSQIKESSGDCSPGDLVRVVTASGKFLAVAYFNPKSEIALRILSRQDVPVDGEFFKNRILKALRFRERLVSDTNAARLISSEADDLPGLVVDRYGDVAVVQFLTLGMEKLRSFVTQALEETIEPKGIYERSDSGSRRLEGLDERTGWIRKSCGDETVIVEKDLSFALQFGQGHKTGFYLDQRENRFLLREMSGPKEVLDAFCYEGAFGLHLARKGCRVTGIDVQADAIRRAEEHRVFNQIPEGLMTFQVGNVFDELKKFEKEKRKFDLVILDPPSFVKKKSALEGALAGYKEILLRSMRILNENGRLAVFSCSYHVDENLLMQASLGAAADTRKSLRVLKFLKQAADHPINPFIPETYYLKGFLFEVS